MINKLLTLLILLCISFSYSYSQQIPNWSSYYENGFMWNPALTAKWSNLEVSVTHRHDWTGFDDAPQTSSVGVQVPFLRRVTRVSMGGFLERDAVGPFSKNSFTYTYSYRIAPKLFGNRLDQLRLGIGAQVNQFRYNPNKLTPFDGLEVDPSLIQEAQSGMGGNITVGAFYLSVDDFNDYKTHYYFGASFNQLLPSKLGTNFLGDIIASPHATLHAGYRYLRSRRSRSYTEPNVMVIYAFDKSINVMANLRYEQKEAYWISGGIVSNGEFFGQMGIMFNEDSFLENLINGGLLKLGIKADYSIGKLRPYAGVGYEVYMAYLFDMDKKF